MDCTINTAATKETAVGCVDDTFDISLCNIRSSDMNDIFSFTGRNIYIKYSSDVRLRQIKGQVPRVQHDTFDFRIHQCFFKIGLNIFGHGRCTLTFHHFFLTGKGGKDHHAIFQLKCSDLEVHIIRNLNVVSDLEFRAVDYVNGRLRHFNRYSKLVAIVHRNSDCFQNFDDLFVRDFFRVITQSQNSVFDILHGFGFFFFIDMNDVFVHQDTSFR